jgi:hypothetical protein
MVVSGKPGPEVGEPPGGEEEVVATMDISGKPGPEVGEHSPTLPPPFTSSSARSGNWSEVLVVYVLRPALAHIFPSRASGVTWVVSRLNLLALTAPVVSEFACFETSSVLTLCKTDKKNISAISSNLKDFCMLGKSRKTHGWHAANEARGLQGRWSSMDFPTKLAPLSLAFSRLSEI